MLKQRKKKMKASKKKRGKGFNEDTNVLLSKYVVDTNLRLSGRELNARMLALKAIDKCDDEDKRKPRLQRIELFFEYQQMKKDAALFFSEALQVKWEGGNFLGSSSNMRVSLNVNGELAVYKPGSTIPVGVAKLLPGAMVGGGSAYKVDDQSRNSSGELQSIALLREGKKQTFIKGGAQNLEVLNRKIKFIQSGCKCTEPAYEMHCRKILVIIMERKTVVTMTMTMTRHQT